MASLENLSKLLSAYERANKFNSAFDAMSRMNTMAEKLIHIHKITYSPLAKMFSAYPPNFEGLAKASRTLSTFRKHSAHLTSTGALFHALRAVDLNNLLYHEFDFEDIIEKESIQENVIIDEAKRIRSIIRDIYQENELIYKITPREFEELIAELLWAKGFKVELTKQTRDGGYDMLAIQDLAGFPMKFLVECKRNRRDRPVQVGIIRSFMDVINTEQANAGIIVTTSYFTKDGNARKAINPNRLHLNDREDVFEWIEQYRSKYIN